MADELSVIEGWLVSTLASDTAVAALVDDRIFDSPPPEGTEYPYIIYNMQVNDDVRGVGVTRIMSDTIYTVKAVVGTGQTDELADVAAAIDSALTLATPTTVGTEGVVEGCVRERIVRYTEYTDGTKYAHRGGEYKVLATLS